MSVSSINLEALSCVLLEAITLSKSVLANLDSKAVLADCEPNIEGS